MKVKLYDTHMHTHFSGDSQEQLEKYIDKAKREARDKIWITDHLDYLPYIADEHYLDMEKYFAEIDEYNEKQTFVKINKGIELGYFKASESKMRELLENYAFDIVLLSIHTLNEGSIFTNAQTIQTEKEQEDLLHSVLLQTIEALESFDDFDVLTHLDYVSRYLPTQQTFTDNVSFLRPLQKVLELIIAKGKCLEVNTKAYGRFHRPNPDWKILKLYFDLGGRKISLGSDAHCVDDMYQFFPEVTKELKAIGFEKVYFYENRQEYTQKL